MCKHEFVKHNDVTACIKCGMTRIAGGKIIFDKKLPNYKPNKKKGKKK